MKRIIISFMIIFVPTLCFSQQEIVVLNGTPLIQCSSSIEGSQNIQLNEGQQAESRLLITKKGDKYFWSTRQNRELTKHQSGIYTIFLEKNGAGYIKVLKNEDKVLYMEHMGIGLQTITYWGAADSFIP